jgi:5-methylcytosine-specific restriction endonuclease McrA
MLLHRHWDIPTKERIMIRIGAPLNVERILELIRDENIGRTTMFGESVSVSGVRLNTFAHKGVTCTFCGKTATYFAMEKHHKSDVSFHLNLYGSSIVGKPILFTRDHIVAHKHGGPNTLENMQTACSKCNEKKGTKTDIEYRELIASY